MTRALPTLFTRPGRRLAFAGCLFGASLAQAGESPARNTVFKSDSGESWTVSIKASSRAPKPAARSVSVPNPIDVTPAVAFAQDNSQPGAPADLPPIPEIKDPASEVRTAHGVTVAPDPRSDIELLGKRYAEAYRAIPFNRAEYDANPSYRHEAAIELVFGQMRPTTVVKQMGPPSVEEPDYNPYQPFLPAYDDLYPWRTRSLRNPVFDPPIAPSFVPGGCVFPRY